MLKLKVIENKPLRLKVDMEFPKIVPVNFQEKTVTPTKELQEVTPDESYTGLSKVTIEAVTSDIDENIKPENIMQGISILGVTGTQTSGYEIEVSNEILIFSNGVIVNDGEVIL